MQGLSGRGCTECPLAAWHCAQWQMNGHLSELTCGDPANGFYDDLQALYLMTPRCACCLVHIPGPHAAPPLPASAVELKPCCRAQL